MNYLKFDQFTSKCQSHPTLDAVFAKILRRFADLADGKQLVVVAPDTSGPTKSLLQNYIGHSSYWRAGAIVIADMEYPDLSSLNSIRQLKRNCELTILTPYLLAQVVRSQEMDSVEIDYGLLSNIHSIERSTRTLITRRGLSIDWGDDEKPMLIRNISPSIRRSLCACLRILKAVNNRYIS